jgi:tetratricopeptide (TPR) repeat protein
MHDQIAYDLREAAHQAVRRGDFESALSLYDQALAAACADATRELITINKADALISLERGGREVELLPEIVMKRGIPRHTYLAAYALQYRFRLEGNWKRARFYGEAALRCADAAGQPSWKRQVYVELGNLHVSQSRIDEAARCFEAALADGEESADNRDLRLSHLYAAESLGHCRIVQGDVAGGLALIEGVLSQCRQPFERSEANLDLCYGYLELGDFVRARAYGELGLAEADSDRLIRNAHYLLGEIAHLEGDTITAEHHFGELARYYPQFGNIIPLLFAIDLRKVVNFKL